MRQERVTSIPEELKRVRIIGAAVAGLMTNEEASRQLGLCLRQIKRLKGKYRSLGEVGLIHGNRGRSPKHKTSDDAQEALVRGAGAKHVANVTARRRPRTSAAGRHRARAPGPARP